MKKGFALLDEQPARDSMTNLPAVRVAVFLFISCAHEPWKEVTATPLNGMSICVLRSRSTRTLLCPLLMSFALRVMTSHSGNTQ